MAVANPPVRRTPPEEFDRRVDLPENADKLFELIDGEVVEVPSDPQASAYSQTIAGEFYIFLRGKDIAHLTGEAGGYVVAGERYAPDVAILLKARQARLVERSYNPTPPDLAAEVDMPTSSQSREQLFNKIINYLAAGTTVWVVRPEYRQVEVYVPGQPKRIFGEDGILEIEDILPGFRLPVSLVFASQP
jgi:Uma2 family endonuclease